MKYAEEHFREQSDEQIITAAGEWLEKLGPQIDMEEVEAALSELRNIRQKAASMQIPAA